MSAAVINPRRTEIVSEIAARTGIDEAMIERLVRRFYEAVRADALLAPIFAAHIVEWEPHLQRMFAFWSSVALMTGRYHGTPVTAHAGLPVTWAHFELWLALFRATAVETCPPAGAAHVIARAERIARSLHMAVEDGARAAGQAVPALR